MNNLKEQLDLELQSVNITVDTEKVKQEYRAFRKRRRTVLITASSFALVIGLTLALLLARRPSPGKTASPDSATEQLNGHSFVLAVSAAEVGEDYLDTLTAEDRELLLKTRGMKIDIETRKFGNWNENGETYTAFKVVHATGNAPVIAYGDGIVTLCFHSEKGSFYVPDLDGEYHECTVEYDAAYPLNAAVYWMIPEAFNDFCDAINREGAVVDFSLIPRDTVTVTATFDDGAQISQKLYLWFNDDGYLVIEDENGNRRNDYSDIAEHNPFAYESDIIQPENVKRAVVTLYYPDKREIQVANVSGLVSELWNMQLYEEVPHRWMSDKSPLITLEMNDGAVHTICIAYTVIRIDGEKAWRASYDCADRLLEFCYGLLDHNDPASAVYGDVPLEFPAP